MKGLMVRKDNSPSPHHPVPHPRVLLVGAVDPSAWSPKPVLWELLEAVMLLWLSPPCRAEGLSSWCWDPRFACIPSPSSPHCGQGWDEALSSHVHFAQGQGSLSKCVIGREDISCRAHVQRERVFVIFTVYYFRLFSHLQKIICY